jgi:hypothetical protein
MTWLKWSEMNWLRLLEGPGDRVSLPIAPTMPSITYRGERYFRMRDTRSDRRGGPAGRSEQGGCYLWDGWWEAQLARARDQASSTASEDAERMKGVLPCGDERDAIWCGDHGNCVNGPASHLWQSDCADTP